MVTGAPTPAGRNDWEMVQYQVHHQSKKRAFVGS